MISRVAKAAKADNLVTLRQPILYAEEMWRRQRIWVLLLVVLGVVMSITMLVTRRGAFDVNSGIWLAYIPCGLLFGGMLLVYRQRSYAEVAEDGLRISNLLRVTVIGYDLVRGVRVQKLEQHFQDARKRYIRPVSRPLLQKNAVFIRLRADDPRVVELRRRLGTQLASEEWLALPVGDPDALAWEITSRLPERTGVNLGGQRRRKRAR
jgi:hypothetical protein